MKVFMFPALETTLIPALKHVLTRMGVSGIHVGAKKLDGTKYPRQVVINSDGGFAVSRVLKEESWRINVWAPTRSEADALASAVEAAIRLLPSASRRVERSEVGEGPIPVDDMDTGEVQRFLTGTTLLRAKITEA